MDALEADDLDRARAAPPGEKLAQALEAMDVGFRLKRAAILAKNPQATEAEIAAEIERWLLAE